MAAVLTLTIVLFWPPDHGFASSYNTGLQAEAHGHLAYSEQNDQHRHLNVKMDADCDASTIGCCVMAHCCPGISVGPDDLPLFTRNDGTTAASADRGTGSDPVMVLPPPRHLPV
ncbi:hypothetical protein [Blastomonas sp.]|uniref:hypothetical protein n=1 Tax=Blastomonas sp. TaxID=1909299 RepID=UPI003593138C